MKHPLQARVDEMDFRYWGYEVSGSELQVLQNVWLGSLDNWVYGSDVTVRDKHAERDDVMEHWIISVDGLDVAWCGPDESVSDCDWTIGPDAILRVPEEGPVLAGFEVKDLREAVRWVINRTNELRLARVGPSAT